MSYVIVKALTQAFIKLWVCVSRGRSLVAEWMGIWTLEALGGAGKNGGLVCVTWQAAVCALF